MEIREEIFLLIVQSLDGTISESDESRLQSWKNDSEENNVAFEEIKSLYHTSGGVKYLDKKHKTEDWVKLRGSVFKSRPFFQSRLGWLAAACLVLVVISVAFLKTPLVENFLYTEMNVKTNGRTVYLPDSSVVTLNEGSRVLVSSSFGEKNRKVILKGEAFFEVKKNNTFPFVITTENTKTTVIGTAFNLRESDTGSHLTVIEGTVKFESKNNAISITQGESANYSRITQEIKEGDFDINNLGWKTGKLYFKSMPITKVFEYLSKTYHVEFTLTNSVDSTLVFTSVIDNEPLGEVLKEIQTVLPLEIPRQGKKYWVRSN